MASIIEKITVEIKNVEKTLDEINQYIIKPDISKGDLRAAASCLTDIYNGIENILKQISEDHRVPLPQSTQWHKDLLNNAVKNSFISNELYIGLSEYRAFRHVFVHAYGFDLKKEEIVRLVLNAPALWAGFLSDVKKKYTLEANSSITPDEQ
ncbi:MAG TPA: hypothetical protein DHV24_12310 [Candidatus Margulisbacteria bacterium]|nr:hypothetical protein [Candidatus Margulisiibacteriota bacterium]